MIEPSAIADFSAEQSVESSDGTSLVDFEAATHQATLRRLEQNVGGVLRGKRDVVRLALVALAARGHVLIEDVPGVGKTTLAQALARSLGLSFQRVQFTSDLLPSDIVGVSVYRRSEERFDFVRGPVFANVLLADEINRATPKTQSALLEAMGEGFVTVDRTRHELPRPFLVLATQNPLEHLGTFSLPESQLDRFLMSLEIGYPERADERDLLLTGGVAEALAALEPVMGASELLSLQAAVARVHVKPKLADYMVRLAEATRSASMLSLGVSTRGLQGLYRASQAMALFDGRVYVVPDDVLRLASPVLSHRVSFRRPTDSRSARVQIRRLMESVAVPL